VEPAPYSMDDVVDTVGEFGGNGTEDGDISRVDNDG